MIHETKSIYQHLNKIFNMYELRACTMQGAYVWVLNEKEYWHTIKHLYATPPMQGRIL
jgi:hypothetical protein